MIRCSVTAPVMVLGVSLALLTTAAVVLGRAPGNAAGAAFVFAEEHALEEAPAPGRSAHGLLWLDSGARLHLSQGIGTTVLGSLPSDDPWRRRYARANALDTDGGFHPQNIFRLVTRSQWDGVHAELSFRILDDHFSNSPNRNESNGVFLMSRYKDAGETLYYAGVRVDGTAIIKKKYRGTYYTLARQPIFPGAYRRDARVNLIPHRAWITLSADTVTRADGSVEITLRILAPGADTKTTILRATDAGQYEGTPPLRGSGASGIRSDFMDVAYRDYLVRDIDSPQR